MVRHFRLRPVVQLTGTHAVLQLFNVVRFPNLVCTGTWGQAGTCYSVQECLDRGGTAYGPCAYGFGVCCSCEFSPATRVIFRLLLV